MTEPIKKIEQLEQQLAEANERNQQGLNLLAAANDKIIEYQTEIADYERLIKLQKSRLGKAADLWRQATNRPNVTPDLGVLLKFLLDEITELKDSLDLRMGEITDLKDALDLRAGAYDKMVEYHDALKKCAKMMSNGIDELLSGLYVTTNALRGNNDKQT